MNMELLLDGRPVVKFEIDLPLLTRMLNEAARPVVLARSTPANETEMRELLARIDQRSAIYLKELAANIDGSITWRRMRVIFGIAKPKDWAAYSASFGKGITRAYRNILNDSTAKLVWWNDADWDQADWDDDLCCVFVDGAALEALREATVE
jgi:hypothetical protein